MTATETRGEAALEGAAALHARLTELGVEVPIRLWDGTSLGPRDADHRLVLRTPWALRSLVTARSDLGIGETYLSDGIDVEGSMVAALRSVAALPERIDRRTRVEVARMVMGLPRPPRELRSHRVSLRGRRHSQQRDSVAVRHHYDQDVAFYRCFLDSHLVYSCGYFAEQDRQAPPGREEALDRAQRRKLDLVCRKLALRPGERLLDVGCGWGSLVLHAAEHHGVEAHGITLSPTQAEVARERIAAAGLQGRARVEVADYREVAGGWDAIASVGMVEHVGADMLPTYAARLHDLLRDGGRLLNHGITTGRRDVVRDFSRERDSFIARYVFPDGALVPAHHMVRVIEQAGLEVWDLEQLRPHYALTLRHWVANLEANADRARDAASELSYRVWRAYMAGSALGFESGDLGVVQILASRGDPGFAFGRDRMALPGDL